MINQIDIQRLAKIKQDIARLQLRYPIATIARRTGLNKGNISKALRGMIPCSDNFVDRFYGSFREDLNKAHFNPSDNQALRSHTLNSHQTEKLKVIANALVELAAIINQIA